MDKEEYRIWIRNRISELRIKKDVSEYQMSLDLGMSRSYINNITTGKVLPSLDLLFDICEYCDVTPAEFFNTVDSNPLMTQEMTEIFTSLNNEDKELVVNTARHLKKYSDRVSAAYKKRR